MKGFFHSYLLIDLTNRSWSRPRVEDPIPRALLGGKGLGVWLLDHHTRRKVDPFSPDNPLVLAVGPATDSRIAGSSRWVAITRSPQTGFLAHSYSGGRMATPMSRSGNDAVVIMGASESPVWLEIDPSGVRFHDAKHLWGAGAHEAEKALLRAIGAKVGAMVVGPAGENLIRFSNITNDKWRQAGRTGAGAVLGSKKVKGITFKGDRRRPHADPDAISAHWKEMVSLCRDNPAVDRYRRLGTPMMVEVMNKASAFPNRYWSRGVMEGWESLSAETMLASMKVTPKACEQCFIACGKLSEAQQGPHAGLVVEGPEYETIFAFGGLCLLRNLEDVLYLNDLCDKLGLDTISAGNLVAFAMEASERGKFPEKIEYGDAAAAARLVEEMAYRKGAGALLSDGIKAAAQTLGLEDVAVHVKGMEPAGYDPRTLKGMGLAYGVSDRGACHLRATFYKAELAGMIDKDQIQGKAEMFMDFEDRATLFDSLILCRFYRDLYTWDQLAQIVRMLCGPTLSKEELQRIASSVADAARRFNLRMGLTEEDDRLPEMFHTSPAKPTESVITREEYEIMRTEYYRLRGWNREGVPE